MRQHRVSAGLSQEQAAARLTVTLRTLQRWEDGETEPRTSQLAGLAKAYGVSVPDLLGIKRAA